MNLRISAVLFGAAFTGILLLTLLDAAAKAFVILALAAIAAVLLRRASAAARHMVWVSALACALVLPCAAWLLPQWRVLPKWMAWEELPKQLTVAAPVRTVTAAPMQLKDLPQPAESAPVVEIPAIEPGLQMAPAAQAVSRVRLSARTVLLIWLCGSVLLSVPLLYSIARLRRISKHARVVSEGLLLSVMRDLQQEIGTRREVRLIMGGEDIMPMVWGVWRPHLLLPSSATSWAPSRLRGVLLHELAHLKRRDPLSLLVAQLALAVHWFNPLAWLAVRQLRVEQERACDDFVLRYGVRASDYASDLLDVATTLRGVHCSPAALAMAHPARLEGRIAGILDAARSRRALTRWGVIVAMVLTNAVTLPLSMLRGADDRKASEKPLVEPEMAKPPQTHKNAGRGRIIDRNGFVLAESADAKSRRYPFRALAAHTLGFTGSNADDGQMEGRSGVEKAFDASLRKGEDVQLTLDARMQSAVEKILRDAGLGRGAVVILNPVSGEVLANVSVPNFDPNAFVPAIGMEEWKALNQNPASPLRNRSGEAYTPGQIYTLAVALAAGRAGKADRVYTCKGVVTYGNKMMQCWKSVAHPESGGHGELNLAQAIKESCNAYFYQLGNEIGIEAIAETAHLLGLGKRTGLAGLTGESPGIVSSPAWLKSISADEKWTAGYTANAAIGQGSTLATPIQLAGVAATIANGGLVLAPQILAGVAPQVNRDLMMEGCKPEHLELIRSSMSDIVQNGSGRKAHTDLISIAGKTGSAQFWRSEGGKRVPEVAAWFVGYAPVEAPRYAFAVFVESGKSGVASTAPLARRIMEAVSKGLPEPEPQPALEGHTRPFDPRNDGGE